MACVSSGNRSASTQGIGPSLTATRSGWTFSLAVVFSLWVVVLFNPDMYLARNGQLFWRSLPNLLYLVLVGLVLNEALRRPRNFIYVPLLVYLGAVLLMVPFAVHTGLARQWAVKILLLYYALAVGSLALIRTPDKASFLCLLFLLQFLWFFIQSDLTSGLSPGQKAGGVPWHPELNNEDGFGPLMLIGMAYSFYFGQAVRSKTLRWLAFSIAAMSLVGVIASFARGAVIGLAVVAAYAWVRSPRKGKASLALLLGIAVLFVATAVLFPGGAFWAEMRSITAEGTSSGTGADRWALWQIGLKVFLRRPIFGVGAGNVGIFAYYNFDPADLVGVYAVNRGALWNKTLHNIYIQVLSESGLVGFIAFIVMIIDFWRRNIALRSSAMVRAWQTATDRRLDLRTLSLGLEAAMVGYLVTGVFYHQLYIHWLYSLLTINVVLFEVASRQSRGQRVSSPVVRRTKRR